MQFDQRETIGFQAAQLAKLVAQLMREALGPLGIQPAQAAALIEIGARPGLSQKELVERLEVEQPGVARTLNGGKDCGSRQPARARRPHADRAGASGRCARSAELGAQGRLKGLRRDRPASIDATSEPDSPAKRHAVAVQNA
jgi:hypothetical protein